MAEEIDNVFENDQIYIRYKTDRHESVCARKASPAKSRTFSKPIDTNRCVCKEHIACKNRPFSKPVDTNRCVCKEHIACKKPNIFKTGRHESVCVQGTHRLQK
ncbi:hypothetical protein AVEN_116055-1 [Araneus ventricosus]|uniref:Uncharacterized protein n=1 Tax=Araneus ventricosus TaxID=182803 RepID=A0A4Y2PAD2_ARAVE|nr:hypothetical protein AVEN_116055-1 [Araneus ventricosus]